jgi:hypothetical protein
MSGSYLLAKRFADPYAVTIPKYVNEPMSDWADSYMINGAHRVCGEGFYSRPIGDNVNGFNICQRKRDVITNSPFEAVANVEYQKSNQLNFSNVKSAEQKKNQDMYIQTFDLYSGIRNKAPRNIFAGGQSRKLQDRRLPFEAHLQGLDYYRDCVKFRGIGSEDVNAIPGEYNYQENKYYFSSPPPLYDITQGVQPYQMWRREQIRMGNITEKQMIEFEKEHTYSETSSTF